MGVVKKRSSATSEVQSELTAGRREIEEFGDEASSVSDWDSLRIEGGFPLCGSVKIDGAKNGVLPLMAAVLLTNEPLVLTNVPEITDVWYMLELLTILGVEGVEQVDEKLGEQTLVLKFSGNKDSIQSTLQSPGSVQKILELSEKFRASYFILGPLVGRFGVGILARSGGCRLGSRPTNFHVAAMKAFGADIQESGMFQRISIPEWRFENNLMGGADIGVYEYCFPKISVGATINAVLAAVTLKWRSHLSNCAMEPEVLDVCACLRKMGAVIDVRGREIQVTGVPLLNGAAHRVLPDRIEAGTFMIATAATRGNVTLTNIENPYPLVGNVGDLLSRAGFAVTYGESCVRVSTYGGSSPDTPTIQEIQTMEYPGFPTDLQSQMLVLLSGWDEVTNCRIVENIWEDRFKQVPELHKMGAQIEIVSPREAVIERGSKLCGVTVVASDLRDAAALCIAGLSTAKGEVTVVKNVHHLDRGYSLFEEKLKRCGAQLRRVQNCTQESHTMATDTNYWQGSIRKGTCLDHSVLAHTIYTICILHT